MATLGKEADFLFGLHEVQFAGREQSSGDVAQTGFLVLVGLDRQHPADKTLNLRHKADLQQGVH